MSIMCRAVHIALPTVGESGLTAPLAGHVDSCVPCRAEAIRYRTMYRELDGLALEAQRAPAGLASGVLESLGPVAVVSEPARRDNRVPVAAVAVVATAAAGTAVLLRLYRQRAA